MKKISALFLILALIFSLAACTNSATKNISPDITEDNEDVSEKAELPSENDLTSSDSDTTDSITGEISFEDVKNFDDFVNKLDESGYEMNQTETEDGSIIIDMTPPTTEDKETDSDNNNNKVPTIPTIDTTRPTPPAPTPAEPEEDKNTSDDKDTSDDTSSEDTSSQTKPDTSEDENVPKEETTPETEIVTPENKEDKKPMYTYTTGQTHKKLDYTNRYLYSLLDDEMKGWYRKIDAAVNNLDGRVFLDTELTEDQRYYIYYLYMFDNPEHFYLGNSVTIYTKGGPHDGLILCYSDGNLTCRFGGALSEINDELRKGIRAKQAVFNAEVNRILSTIPSDAPDVVKEKLIYDRILIDSHYNLGAKWDGIAEDNWTAYGIMVNKMGVCESYSEAFQTLCLFAGINCTGVIGTAGGGHKWNCVELDGEWYMCDITFDDPIGGIPGEAGHYYFNLTSAKMTEYNHKWEDSIWPAPDCTATKYSYANYFGNY